MNLKKALEILQHKEFRYFVLARFLLTIAIQLQMSSIILQIYYEHTKDELALGVVGLAEVIPFILTSFVSGYLSDILDRRKLLIATLLGLFAESLILFFNETGVFHLTQNITLLLLYCIVFIFGVLRSFGASTTAPFMSQIVPRSLYTQSATWNSAAWHLGSILGPVVAGIIYGQTHHATWNYILTCICFLASGLCFMMIKSKPRDIVITENNFFKNVKNGFQFVFKHKLMLSALTIDLFAVLFGGAVVLIPAFTDKVLHLGPEAYGMLRTAPAIGAVLMALYLTFFPLKHQAGKKLLLAVTAFGILTILFALSTNYWLAFVILIWLGIVDNVSVVVRHSILQLCTPDEMRGRVAAVNSIFIGSSNELGAFESGVAAKLLGLVPSIIFGGVMTILVVLGVNKWNPDLKKLDLSKLE